jgi:hypothetical protein
MVGIVAGAVCGPPRAVVAKLGRPPNQTSPVANGSPGGPPPITAPAMMAPALVGMSGGKLAGSAGGPPGIAAAALVGMSGGAPGIATPMLVGMPGGAPGIATPMLVGMLGAALAIGCGAVSAAADMPTGTPGAVTGSVLSSATPGV